MWIYVMWMFFVSGCFGVGFSTIYIVMMLQAHCVIKVKMMHSISATTILARNVSEKVKHEI